MLVYVGVVKKNYQWLLNYHLTSHCIHASVYLLSDLHIIINIIKFLLSLLLLGNSNYTINDVAEQTISVGKLWENKWT